MLSLGTWFLSPTTQLAALGFAHICDFHFFDAATALAFLLYVRDFSLHLKKAFGDSQKQSL